MTIPKRVASRIDSGIKRFSKILQAAKDADRSEQDTVTIITDMLSEMFGYDKYSELTGEYAIRGTYCDIAVQIGGKVQYLLEVKAIDKTLKSSHARQASDYAAKEGIEWVVLTNGVEWQVLRTVFEKPVRTETAFTFNFLEDGKDLREKVYILTREALAKRAIHAYHQQIQAINRHLLAAVALSEPVVAVIRRELRRMNPDVRIDVEDITEVLRGQVLKRDVVDGEEFAAACKSLSKAQKTALRLKPKKTPTPKATQ